MRIVNVQCWLFLDFLGTLKTAARGTFYFVAILYYFDEFYEFNIPKNYDWRTRDFYLADASKIFFFFFFKVRLNIFGQGNRRK